MGAVNSNTSETADVFTADSFLLSSSKRGDDGRSLVFPLPASHRGLANSAGQNNCFLNVTVQALWHLGPFRTELRRLIDHQVHENNTERSMNSSYATIDSECHKPHLNENVKNLGEPGAHADGECDNDGFVHVNLSSPASDARIGIIDALCNLFAKYELSDLHVLPPDELRTTLQAITGRFDLGAIADANEALDAVLGHIHIESAKNCPDTKKCLSHAVFGGVIMEQTFCPSCDATSEPMLRTAFMQNIYAAEIVEIARRNPHESFASLIGRCSGVAQKECPSADDNPPPRPACKSKANVRMFCLEAPLALALSIGWTSTSEPLSTLRNFYRLVSRSLSLNQLYMPSGGATTDASDSSGSPEYLFRGMVCYYGLHYVSIFQEFGTKEARFLLFDDKNVRPIGSWDAVVELALKARYQPVCLLYESSARSSNETLAGSAATTATASVTVTSSLTASTVTDSSDASPTPKLETAVSSASMSGNVLEFSSSPQVYEVCLKKGLTYTVDRGEPIYVFGFQPLVTAAGKVLIGELFSDAKTGALPAVAAGVGLLDEILTVDGQPCVPIGAEGNVSHYFKANVVRLRLRSSYKRSLVYFCPHCKEENPLQAGDIELIRAQFKTLNAASHMCCCCDRRNVVPSLKDLENAILQYLG